MKYFIANWKANKNLKEALLWVDELKALLVESKKTLDAIEAEEVKIIICPPYPLIIPISEALDKIKKIQFGSQDLSFYNAGAYTGEVAVRTLEGIVSYSIIGHSERRKYFKDSDASVDQKVQLANEHGIEPIVCVRDAHDLIPKGIKIVAYEPIEAIGSGANQPVEETLVMRHDLHIGRDVTFLYGGSVNEQNASEYTKHNEIDGLLIGGASLDPESFYKIINSAL